MIKMLNKKKKINPKNEDTFLAKDELSRDKIWLSQL